MTAPLKLNFDKGTLTLQNVPEALQPQLVHIRWDERTLTFRAPAYHYRHIVSQLRAHDIPYQDTARQFTVESFTDQKDVTPYPYQTEAIDAWHANGKRGVISPSDRCWQNAHRDYANCGYTTSDARACANAGFNAPVV